jgi:hypothetical protein
VARSGLQRKKPPHWAETFHISEIRATRSLPRAPSYFLAAFFFGAAFFTAFFFTGIVMPPKNLLP